VRYGLVVPGLFSSEAEYVLWKIVLVGVAWCWGISIAATLFHPAVGALRPSSGRQPLAQGGAKRLYAATFLTIYLLAPLLVVPLG